nr:uncharacterized protein LOC111418601 [Onthophagus taurus]
MSANENWNSEELDSETIKKLKGDVIENTAYSKGFILKTLLKLSDLNWSDELEDELCFLWDMTVEEEVCSYLIKISFPSIAASSILKYKDLTRFVEILIGILGNIVSKLCIKEVEVINTVLVFMESDDHLILIQVIRFIKGLDHFINDNNENLIYTKKVIDRFGFILTSSLNKDLLLITLDVLSKITSNFKIKNEDLSIDIASKSWVGYLEIAKQENDEVIHQQFTLHFIQLMLNLCLYIDEFNNDELQKEIIKNKKEICDLLYNVLMTNLNRINLDEGLELIKDDTLIFYIEAFAIILPLIKFESNENIFSLLLNVLFKLISNNLSFSESFLELLIYFIPEISNSNKQSSYLKKINSVLDYCSKNKLDFKDLDKISRFKNVLDEK